MTDPRLVMRRSRMRRIFTGVMAGAVAILALAGVCSLVRRPDAQSAAPAKIVEPSAPPATPAPVAEPAPVPAPQPAAAAEPQVPLASAAATKAPAPRTNRPKAPHKTRNAHAP
jgi:hypothetical protein